MKVVAVIMGMLLSFAAFGADGKGGTMERFPSRLLRRDVPISVHIPDPAALQAWSSAQPGRRARIVLFLPGAWDGPADLLRTGLYADLAKREAEGRIAPAVWVAVTHYKSWYVDRKDGTFPYERFLMEELLPELERRHPEYGGSAAARSVAGLSMGGFGALNLAARTHAFSRCAALSPALIQPPFRNINWFVRWTIKRVLPTDPESFAPWNPWRHLGGEAELVIGSGTEDEHGLARAVRAFAEVCGERNRQLTVDLGPGKHDWNYWTPEFERLAPWINGGALPQERSSESRP
ncbi:MAG TPA: alpha/beta hydrolase-fold protein [Holophagaceae bacterium]|nr:alpha/beta hydrolase-fold protein [Holophagaceae bacterium]